MSHWLSPIFYGRLDDFLVSYLFFAIKSRKILYGQCSLGRHRKKLASGSNVVMNTLLPLKSASHRKTRLNPICIDQQAAPLQEQFVRRVEQCAQLEGRVSGDETLATFHIRSAVLGDTKHLCHFFLRHARFAAIPVYEHGWIDIPLDRFREADYAYFMERIELITPGEILLTEFLKPNGISQTKLAGDLDIPQSRITEIIKGQRSITVDTAIRLSVYFKTTVNFWLNLQNNFDIEKAERSGEFAAIAARVRCNPMLTVLA